MSIRESVFGSPRERRLFKALQSRWGSNYNLYPGLKFHSIVDLGNIPLTRDERNFLLATEVDYTLCDKEDRPLVSVEFDGVTGGLSRDGRFVPRGRESDADRKWKFDLKLRVSESVGYSFAIVSTEETVGVPGEETPMIVDGIIGQALAQRQTQREVAGLSEVLGDEVEGMSKAERQEHIQHRLIDIETVAEFEHDPFVKLVWDLRAQLRETGCDSGRWRMRFLDDPSVPEVPEHLLRFTGTEDAALLESRARALESRARALDAAGRHGSEVSVVTTVGTFTGRAWIRNFGLGSGSLTLVENIATVRALRRALRAVRKSAGQR